MHDSLLHILVLFTSLILLISAGVIYRQGQTNSQLALALKKHGTGKVARKSVPEH